MCLSDAAHGCGATKKVPLPKICHIYHTMMRLGTVMPYLKKAQKIYEPRDTPLELPPANTQLAPAFFVGNQKNLQYQKIQI